MKTEELNKQLNLERLNNPAIMSVLDNIPADNPLKEYFTFKILGIKNPSFKIESNPAKIFDINSLQCCSDLPLAKDIISTIETNGAMGLSPGAGFPSLNSLSLDSLSKLPVVGDAANLAAQYMPGELQNALTEAMESMMDQLGSELECEDNCKYILKLIEEASIAPPWTTDWNKISKEIDELIDKAEKKLLETLSKRILSIKIKYKISDELNRCIQKANALDKKRDKIGQLSKKDIAQVNKEFEQKKYGMQKKDDVPQLNYEMDLLIKEYQMTKSKYQFIKNKFVAILVGLQNSAFTIINEAGIFLSMKLEMFGDLWDKSEYCKLVQELLKMKNLVSLKDALQPPKISALLDQKELDEAAKTENEMKQSQKCKAQSGIQVDDCGIMATDPTAKTGEDFYDMLGEKTNYLNQPTTPVPTPPAKPVYGPLR